MMLDGVGIVGRGLARVLIARCHYSNVMPRITRFCVGGWKDNRLVAVMTLGFGTRPRHTIEGMFPSLSTEDYLEIGKLCVSDDMPRNTESYFISRALGVIQEQRPNVAVVFSWADGILGKPGYVYQAANFYFGGFIWTEIYLTEDGIKLHPRSVQGLTAGKGEARGPRDFATTSAMGLTKYWGKQFRYIYPLCDKRQWQALERESPYVWQRGSYPKDADCTFEKQIALGKREEVDALPFVRGDYIERELAQGRLFEPHEVTGATQEAFSYD